jgi:hypothetical protein
MFKEYYNRNLEISFVVALSVLSLLFYIFPRFYESTKPNTEFVAPTIEVLYIPSTTQDLEKKPKPVKPFIPVVAEEIDFLENVEIEEIVPGDSGTINLLSGPVNYTELPFTPRQLYDVMPEKTEEAVLGLIVISLWVGIDGEVKDYKIKQNTTNNPSCLTNVISAALQSKWESAVLNDQKVEYWIDKTYRFR